MISLVPGDVFSELMASSLQNEIDKRRYVQIVFYFTQQLLVRKCFLRSLVLLVCHADLRALGVGTNEV